MKKLTKENIKIFEASTVREALANCLEEGYMPAGVKEIYDLKKQNKIPIQWYDSGTLYFEGKIKTATISQLKNIEKIYQENGRLLFVGNVDNFGLIGYYGLLNYNGRFVGVRRNKHKVK